MRKLREAQSQEGRQKMESKRRKHSTSVATANTDHGPCSRQSGPFHLVTDVRASLSKYIPVDCFTYTAEDVLCNFNNTKTFSMSHNMT